VEEGSKLKIFIGEREIRLDETWGWSFSTGLGKTSTVGLFFIVSQQHKES